MLEKFVVIPLEEEVASQDGATLFKLLKMEVSRLLNENM
jgi:hypothetical protein